MDRREEARSFLRSRRARMTPQAAGLPDLGERRRVPGLRREEVAVRAGVSLEYYVQLERGNLSGASDGALHALARALDLDDAEQQHLHDLARGGARPEPAADQLSPSLSRVLDALAVPALVRNARLDYIAGNAAGRALYCELFDTDATPNQARYVFLDPRARRFFADWDAVAGDMAAMLRAEAARQPADEALGALIAELLEGSEPFHALWARHEVRLPRSGSEKHFMHPQVGELFVVIDTMAVRGPGRLTLWAATADPGSPSEAALLRLQAG